jgi:hypothetical protein
MKNKGGQMKMAFAMVVCAAGFSAAAAEIKLVGSTGVRAASKRALLMTSTAVTPLAQCERPGARFTSDEGLELSSGTSSG